MTASEKKLDGNRLSATPRTSEPSADTEEEQLLPDIEEDGAQPPSEVAMRLNLLGKLIIPPSAP